MKKKITSLRISNEEMWPTQYTRGYQKVRRLVRWNLYILSYAYNFCRENKTTNFLLVGGI